MSKLSFEKGVVVWGVGNQPFFFFWGGAVFLLISFTVPVLFLFFFSEYISEKIENRCFMA